MKNFLKKITAISMVAILMLSTTSFSLFKHFCGENLVNISFEKVDSCCKSESESSLISNANLNFSTKKCCKNETTLKDVLPFDFTNTIKITKNQTLFLTSFYYSFIEKPAAVKTSKNYYKDFSPPNLVIDKQVLFQTFLI